MTIFDDLNIAVTKVTASFNELDTAIQAEIKAMQTGVNAGDLSAVQSAIDNLSALSAKMSTDVASLNASLVMV
jgi:hypothetical protein